MKKISSAAAIRCGQCNRLLARGQVVDIQIKCPRCGTINQLRGQTSTPERQRASLSQETLDVDEKCSIDL